jgi:hypothetical protein
MARELTTCENTGTVIKSKRYGFTATIVGTYPTAQFFTGDGTTGFIVEKEGEKVALPFKNIDMFEVME